MPTRRYDSLRALELEGRPSSDAGCWLVTMLRLEVGEGFPRPDTPWAVVTVPDGRPFPPTICPPPEVLRRNFYYRRIRSSAECDRYILLLPKGRLVRAAFQLTAAWADPPGGMIPPPSDADPPIPHTHAAPLIDRDPDRRLFQFRLMWSNWGDGGIGYMPYEYFDRYVFDCWANYGPAEGLRQYRLKKLDDEGLVRWSAHDELDHHIYAFEVRDSRGNERRAWAFVVERDGALEVEEIYVRPEYRGLGHGRWLADRVAQLARAKGMPLRLWVGFADCKAESERNYPALVSTARRLGVQFQPCSMSWAAYFGTNEQPGEVFPIEPRTIPDRPRAPRNAVRAFVLALSLGQAEPSVGAVPSVPAHQDSVLLKPAPDDAGRGEAGGRELGSVDPPGGSDANPALLVADTSGTVRVAGTRVPLETVIEHFRGGESAEAIAERFPVLAAADVHAVLAYYLRHRDEVDHYLAEQDRQADETMASLADHHQSWEKVSERLRARQSTGAGDDAALPRG